MTWRKKVVERIYFLQVAFRGNPDSPGSKEPLSLVSIGAEIDELRPKVADRIIHIEEAAESIK